MSERVSRRVRLDALFDEALDLDGPARETFIEHIALGDPAMANDLRELLALVDRSNPQLEPDALLRNPVWSNALHDAQGGEYAKKLQPSTSIGVWQIVRELGHGGMGTVYLVEREGEDFTQQGALKRIRPGIDFNEFLERFTQERRILARLNHPNIARLLDGGRDETGLPYLVMEYVNGVDINRYCNEHHLNLRQRIGLFMQVGNAVAYAHRNLIIHRDLKPSNIVVSPEGEIKLLDFGIARVLSTEDTGAWSNSAHGATRLFTPEYATPEQVSGKPMGTAGDVYQLGLLLYELVCGHRAQSFNESTLAQIETLVCHSMPAPPSQRIEAKDDTQARFATESAALHRQLRGDIDTIVLHALRKEPERRYASASDFVGDLQRWLDGLPVLAQPESVQYRLGKFVRRHPFGVTATVLGVLMLIGYAGTVTWQARTISIERDRAQLEASKARQAQRLMMRLFEGADPEHAAGEKLSARELLDRGWSDIAVELEDQPEMRAELSLTIGEAYLQLGLMDQANTMFKQATQAVNAVTDAPKLLTAKALHSRGRHALDKGELDTAETYLSQARQQIGDSNEDDRLAHILADTGKLWMQRGDYSRADTIYREVIDLRIADYGEQHPLVAEAYDDLGVLMRRQGDYPAAKAMLEKALTMRRTLLPESHPQLAQSLSNLAGVEMELGNYKKAKIIYIEALKMVIDSRGENHIYVANIMTLLAQVNSLNKDYNESIKLLNNAFDITRNTFGENHPTIAFLKNEIGINYLSLKDFKSARLNFEESLDLYEKDNPLRAMPVSNMGKVEEELENFNEAEAHYRNALSLMTEQFGETHDKVGMQHSRLGLVLMKMGKYQEAEKELRHVVAIYRSRLPEGHPRLAVAMQRLGSTLAKTDQLEEAKTLLSSAWQAQMKNFGPEDPLTKEAANALASVNSSNIKN